MTDVIPDLPRVSAVNCPIRVGTFIVKNGLSEKQVKDAIKRRLKKLGPVVRCTMPVPMGMGEAGVSDMLLCVAGKYVCIETKAGTGRAKVSDHQVKYIETIIAAGGHGIITSCPEIALEFVKQIIAEERRDDMRVSEMQEAV